MQKQAIQNEISSLKNRADHLKKISDAGPLVGVSLLFPTDSALKEQKTILQNLKLQNASTTLSFLERDPEERFNLVQLEKTLNASSGQIRELEKTEKELGEKQQDATKNLNAAKNRMCSISNMKRHLKPISRCV